MFLLLILSVVLFGCKEDKDKLFVIADMKEFNLSKLKVEKTLYNNAYKTNIGYVVVTGIGKVKATYSLTKFLTLYSNKVDSIYNIGTAGATANNKWGDMVECRKFVQNDYQFKKDIEKKYSLFDKDNDYVCYTTDKFITDAHTSGKFVFEMESYALAEVANNFGFGDRFYAIKFVSDIVGKNTVEHWDNDADNLSERLTKKMVEISSIANK